MLTQNNSDGIRIVFDDRRLVADAGLLLPATLARHLGLREFVDFACAPGRANTGDKMLTLVASALAGGDCVDDTDVRCVPVAGRSVSRQPWPGLDPSSIRSLAWST